MTNPQPLTVDRRHSSDYRDEIEHAEVAAVLAELPEDHPARVAYYSGAREASDSLSLSRLLADRMDLAERLTAAYLGHNDRIWARYTGRGKYTGPLNIRPGRASSDAR